nr:MAG TPA: hypothetical protein [Caudoviricetes sp.]
MHKLHCLKDKMLHLDSSRLLQHSKKIIDKL